MPALHFPPAMAPPEGEREQVHGEEDGAVGEGAGAG